MEDKKYSRIHNFPSSSIHDENNLERCWSNKVAFIQHLTKCWEGNTKGGGSKGHLDISTEGKTLVPCTEDLRYPPTSLSSLL